MTASEPGKYTFTPHPAVNNLLDAIIKPAALRPGPWLDGCDSISVICLDRKSEENAKYIIDGPVPNEWIIDLTNLSLDPPFSLMIKTNCLDLVLARRPGGEVALQLRGLVEPRYVKTVKDLASISSFLVSVFRAGDYDQRNQHHQFRIIAAEPKLNIYEKTCEPDGSIPFDLLLTGELSVWHSDAAGLPEGVVIHMTPAFYWADRNTAWRQPKLKGGEEKPHA